MWPLTLAGACSCRKDPPPFDHRCFTNPVWLLPVQASVATMSTERIMPPASVTAVLRFPISMRPVRPEAWLPPPGADGATTGERVPLVPASGAGWSANPRENLADAVLTLVTAGPLDRAATSGGRFFLVLRGPEDAFANRLNSLGWVMEVPAP